MRAALGVEPGSVTPFALVNESAAAVTVVLDAEMLMRDPLNYHPLVNTATTALAPADLLRFLAACGHRPRILDLADLDRAAPA
jgi:Ala-tRNA(Pro) deacylase